MALSHISMLSALLVSGLRFPEAAYDVLQGGQGGKMPCADVGISTCIGNIETGLCSEKDSMTEGIPG